MTERTTNSEAAASLVDIELGASAMYDAQPRVQPDPPVCGFFRYRCRWLLAPE